MSEILKNLWAKLYAWAVPSALALGVYYFFVYPKTTLGHEWFGKATDAEKIAIFVALTAVIALILDASSQPLYRVLEGYLWPEFLQNWGTMRQLKRKQALQQISTTPGWKRGLALDKLALYPKREDQVVPTRFGNAIRAFETYGKSRFNLDSQTLWYELYAVAPKYIQNEIQEARSSVDFFVALVYLSVLLGLVSFIIAAIEGFDLSILIVCALAFIAALIWSRMAINATGDWGYTVKALVNIGRVKLADGMGLELPETLEKEREMWGLVTKYVFFGEKADGDKLDPFRKKPATGAQQAPTIRQQAPPNQSAPDPDGGEEEPSDETAEL
jgi:hypothetical protein